MERNTRTQQQLPVCSHEPLSLHVHFIPLSPRHYCVTQTSVSMGCNQLRCHNSYCISKDLACDNVNHCGDDSDERGYSLCFSKSSFLYFIQNPVHHRLMICTTCTAAQDVESAMVLGVDFNVFIGIVLSIFVVCLVCVVNLIVCLCRNNQLQQQHRIALHGQSTTALAHPVSFNGKSISRKRTS